ncbi:hypothetical protein P9112_012156 [Eukaryota sp. TZLM1-RC]
MSKSGIAIGANHGHITTPITDVKKTRQSRKKGQATKRVTMRRALIREVAGFAPYERRMMELLKLGLDRRALRFAKKRLGTHIRAKSKREEIASVLRAMRAKKSE